MERNAILGTIIPSSLVILNLPPEASLALMGGIENLDPHVREDDAFYCSSERSESRTNNIAIKQFVFLFSLGNECGKKSNKQNSQ